MKKVFFAVSAVFALLGAKAQDITGSGNVVTREVNVSGFSNINLNGIMSVVITQGSKESVKVETDDNLQDKIVVENKGNTLYVKNSKGNWKQSKKMVVYITFRNVDEIVNNLVGTLTGDNLIKQQQLNYKSSAVGRTSLELEVKDLKLDLSAVGKTTLEGKATNCDMKNSSVGYVDASDLAVDNLTLDNSAVGALDYNAKNMVSMRNNGIGRVSNKVKKQTR